MAVIAIDLDNTLVTYPEGKAIAGAKEAINKLRENGHKIIINTCNNPAYAEKILNENDIRFDHIHVKSDGAKALADLYIDDRGYDFKGNWAETIKEVLEHRHVKDKDNRKW